MYKRRRNFSVPFKGAGATGIVGQAAATTTVALKPAQPDSEDTGRDPEKENQAPIQLPVFKKPKLFQAPAAAVGPQQQNKQAAPSQLAPPAPGAETAGEAVTFAVLYTKRAKFTVGGMQPEQNG
jgi:hypothetical protein